MNRKIKLCLWIFVAFLIGAIGANPRFINELKIGGGYSDTVDGGIDFEDDGTILTDGALSQDGGTLTVGNTTDTTTTNSTIQFGSTNPETLTFDGAGDDRFEFSDDVYATGTISAGGGITGTVTASIVIGTGSTTDAVDLATAEVAGTLPVANGGTASATASDARTALGVAIGSDVPAWDADLDYLAGRSWGSDGNVHVQTGSAGAVTAHTDADDLVVEHSSHGGISILNPSTHQGRIFFGDESSNVVGRINYTHTTDTMDFFTGGGQRASLSSAGLTVLSDLNVNGGDLDSTAGTLNIAATPGYVTIGANATVTISGVGNTTILPGLIIVQGNMTFGDSSADTLSCNGRLRHRLVSDAGPMTSTAGTAGEIVYNMSNSKFYGCTVTGSPATWAALN